MYSDSREAPIAWPGLIDEQVWNIGQARQIYRVREWSDGYFDINEFGRLTATLGQKANAIDLYQLAGTIQEQGLSLPVLVRFTDILQDWVYRINQAFASARQEYDYDAAYLRCTQSKLTSNVMWWKTSFLRGRWGWKLAVSLN